MASADGRFHISFNGEIYNFEELREELLKVGHTFRGTSDTEVLLAGFIQFGIEATIRQAAGMFAMGIWDDTRDELWLIRDRVGEKPLYYGVVGGRLAFASELKAFTSLPGFSGDLDPEGLRTYSRYGYVASPSTIYRGIHTLPAGHLLLATREGVGSPRSYWPVGDLPARTRHDQDDPAAINALEKVLRQAVAQRMIADVPLGAFLSGGIDSSTIVALMQEHSSVPVRTFSIGFGDASLDEAPYAKAVATHLGTDHTEFYVEPEDVLKLIPRLARIYDEPFADSSQIPTFLVASLARRHVTVALSGDGGDEVFGGYKRYFLAPRLWRKVRWLPKGVRREIGSAIRSVSPPTWNKVFDPISRIPMMKVPPNPGHKLHVASNYLDADSFAMLYEELVSLWGSNVLRGPIAKHVPVIEKLEGRLSLAGLDPVERMMLADTLTYLPDDILVKVDRATMAVSLEARAPLLDHRVIEFAWTLPLHMKVRGGVGKWILRQLAYRRIPRGLLDRPKVGFALPLNDWLRGSLRPWAELLLDERRLSEQKIFNAPVIAKTWQEHVSGKRNWHRPLWVVLMFQLWMDENPRFRERVLLAAEQSIGR
jgi:asparagine synthase (glutamine-hydrolysing)